MEIWLFMITIGRVPVLATTSVVAASLVLMHRLSNFRKDRHWRAVLDRYAERQLAIKTYSGRQTDARAQSKTR